VVNAGTNADDGEASVGSEATQQDSRTQLHKLRDAIRRRFGQQTIRSKAEITVNMEHTAGTSIETSEQRRLRLGKAPMEPQELRSEENLQTHEIPREQRRAAPTPPTAQYPRRAADFPGRTRIKTRPAWEAEEAETGAAANTPWGLWTATDGAQKDNVVSHATLATILEESRRDMLGREISQRDQSYFGRKAWMQSDKSSRAWVTDCPKGHNGLNARQFPLVVHAYFGVEQQCLTGLVGQYIRQKSRRREEGSGDGV